MCSNLAESLGESFLYRSQTFWRFHEANVVVTSLQFSFIWLKATPIEYIASRGTAVYTENYVASNGSSQAVFTSMYFDEDWREYRR